MQEATLNARKARALTVIDGLKKLYPDAVCSLSYATPLQLLIATRLSAQCTDRRVNMVTEKLFSAFPALESFCAADVADIEKIILPCGLYHTKANDIRNICVMIRDEFGGEVPDNMDDLLRLPGVGRKTANLILGDVFGKPAIVADTHCVRISNRLGLAEGKDAYKVEMQLREIVPPDEGNDLCHRFVLFGRDVCAARVPKCGGCPLFHCCQDDKSKEGFDRNGFAHRLEFRALVR